MTTIKKDGYVFSVDIDKTKEYYRTHSLCACACCRNFNAQAKEKFPALDAFLRRFGVDIARPDEACSVEEGGVIDYLSVDYTVCGRIETMGEYEIDVYDGPVPASIIATNGFSSPNEQSGEYFTLSVMNLRLPFRLDEPLPGAAPVKTKKNILRKIFKA